MAIDLAADSVASPPATRTSSNGNGNGAGPITDTAQAMAALGATRDVLPPEAYDQLDREGFLVLPDVVDPDWLAQLQNRLKELQVSEGPSAGHEVARQPGVNMLANLLNKGVMFERMIKVPQVLAAAHHVLGDVRVNSLNFRSAPPGHGAQELHSDCGFNLREDGSYRICNSMWVVDDFTTENGATRVVPGTHSSGRLPEDVVDDVMAPHPDEQLVTAKAGAVIVFNAHLWHSGTVNRTQVPRGGMTLSFTRRDERQQLNQAEYIRKQVYDRLSEAERYLMDV